MTPSPITLGTRPGTVVYIDDAWQPVPPERATHAKVLFDDGGSAFYRVKAQDLRVGGSAKSGHWGHQGGKGGPGNPGGSTKGSTASGRATPVTYSAEDKQIVNEYAGNEDPPEGMYVGDGLNGLLRGVSRYYTETPETYTPAQEAYYRQQVDDLQTIIEKTRTTKDQVFYRGVDGRLAGKLVDGTVFVDKGFTSITTDRTIAEERFTGFTPMENVTGAIPKGRVFEIHVPKGTPLLDVDRVLNPTRDREYTTEREHLLGHGTRFRVRGNRLEVIPVGRTR